MNNDDKRRVMLLKKYFKDRFKLTAILILIISLILGFAVGYGIAVFKTLNFCVDVGLRVLSLDGVNLGFSDAMKGVLKFYAGEWN